MSATPLEFCRSCLASHGAAPDGCCPDCGGELLALLDAGGGLARDYLAARGFCCANGCRNCPYGATEAGQPEADVAKAKTCACCGAGFACHGGGCWCDAVKLSPSVLEMLRTRFEDCLCRGCLSGFAKENVDLKSA